MNNRVPASCPGYFSRRARTRWNQGAAALLLVLGGMIGSSSVWAQAVFGSLVGTITDPSGAVVANATVTVLDVNKGISQTATTNASGNFEVSRLIPDTYTVKVESKGFSPAEADNISLVAGEPQQVNLQLSAEGATQTVQVTTGEPPLKTDQADVAQVLSAQQVNSIPNIDRNLTQLVLQSPGVQRSSFSIAPTQNPQGTV